MAEYADQSLSSLFSRSRTSGHEPLLPGTSSSLIFALIRCTLFLDGLAAQIPLAILPPVVRPERVTKEFEAFLPGVPD
jgi:hypothetical protein